MSAAAEQAERRSSTLASEDDDLAGFAIPTMRELLRDRLRDGDLGPLPIVVGLLIIAAVFTAVDPAFISPSNLVFLAFQMVPVGVLALGVVLVLLLGEIDLSVGSVAGATSALFAVLLVEQGWSFPLALLATLATGALIGACYGVVLTKIGVPSFVLTLAGLLGFLGLQLTLLEASIPLPNGSVLTELGRGAFLPDLLSYAIGLATATAYAAAGLRHRSRRAAAGLEAASAPRVLLQAGLLAVGLVLAAWYLNRDQGTRGVSLVLVLFVALVVLTDLVLRKTRWGRSVFALGGNVDAARRAGLPVDRIYIQVFTVASMLAAVGGLLAAGGLGSVNTATGAEDTNLQAIAAAVIGGTSLFGGRGSAYAALLGILVIFSIQSGLSLQSSDAGPQYMVYGGVTLLAVTVDSLTRKARARRGGR